VRRHATRRRSKSIGRTGISASWPTRILPEGGWEDYVLVPQRRPLRADQLRGLRLIVRREGVGAIYERVRHT
jgi:hypothetical protein